MDNSSIKKYNNICFELENNHPGSREKQSLLEIDNHKNNCLNDTQKNNVSIKNLNIINKDKEKSFTELEKQNKINQNNNQKAKMDELHSVEQKIDGKKANSSDKKFYNEEANLENKKTKDDLKTKKEMDYHKVNGKKIKEENYLIKNDENTDISFRNSDMINYDNNDNIKKANNGKKDENHDSYSKVMEETVNKINKLKQNNIFEGEALNNKSINKGIAKNKLNSDNEKINDLEENKINEKDSNEIEESSESSDSSDDNYYGNSYSLNNNSEICGIKNLGNNCYLNSGLQILASCEEFLDILDTEEFQKFGKIVILFKNAMNSLLTKHIYNPKKFIQLFCKLNKDFIKGMQNCSQNFIRTIIMNINKEFIKKQCKLIYKNAQWSDISNKEYKNFLNKIYPESNVVSIFSCITKAHSAGKCPNCGEKIDNYSFSYFIDQNMYLDEFYNRCKFSEVLKANIGNESNLILDCPTCKKEIEIKEETKIIKLPEILIFTLERYQGQTNKVKIEPDKILDMKEYIDKSINVDNTLYELFAINVRFGSTANFGHEICQVKRNGKWYEINDSNGHEINEISYFDSSYGLFYRKIKHNIEDNNYYFDLKEIKQINSGNSQNFFISTLKFITSPIYFLFSNNKDDLNYVKQGLYILSSCDNFINDLSKINFKKRNLISLTKIAILKILEKNIYDDSDFSQEFYKISKSNEKLNEGNSEFFIQNLINCINIELVKIKYNLCEEKAVKYYPKKEDEIIEYNKFIQKIFPQSVVLFNFSSINKTYIYGKCKCNQEICEYSFEQFITKKISLENIKNDSPLSKILKNLFSVNEIKKKCCKCCKKKMNFTMEKKFIKLGDILIFIFDKNPKNIKIKPDYFLDLKNYIDNSIEKEETTYELFAISFKFGIKENNIYQKCIIKRKGEWIEINDNYDKKNSQENINALYYKKIKKK